LPNASSDVGIERVIPRAHDRQEAVRIIQQHATLRRPRPNRSREWELLRRDAQRARVEAEEVREAAREACARAQVQVDRARRLASTITVHLHNSILAADLAGHLGEHVYLIERPQGTDVKITECNGDTLSHICDWASRNRLQTVDVTVDGETRTLAA